MQGLTDGVVSAPGRRLRSRTLWTVVAVVVATALTASIAIAPELLRSAPEGLSGAGPRMELFAVATRGIRVLGAVATAGALAVAVLVVPGQEASRRRGLMVAAGRWAVVWLVATVCAAVLEVARASTVSIADVVSERRVPAFVIEEEIRGLVVAAWAAALVAVAAKRVVTGSGALMVLIVAGGGLVPPVVTGHPGVGAAHALALGSLIVHMVAISLWAGGLLALAMHADASVRLDASALSRFSTLALVCFVAVALSGGVSVMSRMSFAELLDSGGYGLLLLLKLTIFLALGAAGHRHRKHTLRQIATDAGQRFWGLVMVEIVWMAAAIGLAVTLAATAPHGVDTPPHAAAISAP